eukprot:3543393-Rhodomonas_salina.1
MPSHLSKEQRPVLLRSRFVVQATCVACASCCSWVWMRHAHHRHPQLPSWGHARRKTKRYTCSRMTFDVVQRHAHL